MMDGAAIAAVIKDAGDDPDVTHGAEVSATLRPGAAGSGVTFRAGPGVGMVTSRMLGVLRDDPTTRREFLSIIGTPNPSGQ